MSDAAAKPKPHLVGGFGSEKPATPEVQEICDSVRPDFENRSGVNTNILEAKSYKTQVVAGTVYLIKAKYEENKYTVLRVFEPLPYTQQPPSLQNFKLDLTEQDELEP